MIRAACLLLPRKRFRTSAMEVAELLPPRGLTWNTAGAGIVVGASVVLLLIQASMPVTRKSPTTTPEEMPMIQPILRGEATGGSPAARRVTEAGLRRAARGSTFSPFAGTLSCSSRLSQAGFGSSCTGAVFRGATMAAGADPFTVIGGLGVDSATGPGTARTCETASGPRLATVDAGSWRSSDPRGGLDLRVLFGGELGVFGVVEGGAGVADCDTCQTLRGVGDGSLPPLGVFGTFDGLFSPGTVPIAAGESCGISCSDGGGIGVWVHGVSASATSCGVWKR